MKIILKIFLRILINFLIFIQKNQNIEFIEKIIFKIKFLFKIIYTIDY
jgi:hypothetical protein